MDLHDAIKKRSDLLAYEERQVLLDVLPLENNGKPVILGFNNKAELDFLNTAVGQFPNVEWLRLSTKPPLVLDKGKP